MERKKKQETEIDLDDRVEFLHSGSTLVNLAASSKGRKGGWARGRVVNLVGDGSSGKTLLALEACVHAFYQLDLTPKLFPKVTKVTICYNNVEGAMDFPLVKMYGKKFVKAVEWVQISACEKWGRDYQRRVQALKAGEFLLYIVDSLDALVSNVSKARVDKSIKNDEDEEGAYKVEKAAYLSKSFFNHLCDMMQGKDATLLIISQVRCNIRAKFTEYQRAGGKSLDFYTHQVCWLAVIKKLHKEIKGRKKTYGMIVRANFKRNKAAVPYRETDFNIVLGYGVDDIQSMLTYLGSKDPVSMYEDDPIAKERLIDMVEKDWELAEQKSRPKRKKRFED